MVTFAKQNVMQYLFISIFVLSNLLNFSTQMGCLKGDQKGQTIRKKVNSGIAAASVEFILEETEDNKEQEEHDSPDIHGGSFQGLLTGFTRNVIQFLGSYQTSGISDTCVPAKIFLLLHNIRI